MKKKLCLLLAASFCMTPVLGLVACGDDVAELDLGVRYICDDDNMRSEDDYKKTHVTFYKNGTGLYHYYYYESNWATDSRTSDYTIRFKYTYVDNDKSTVACFYYGSTTFGESHNASEYERSSWSAVYTISKNVLMSLNGKMFINENYLNEEVPDYK